jgi:transposase
MDGLREKSMVTIFLFKGKKKNLNRKIGELQEVSQPFYYEDGRLKGIKTILKERGLWNSELKLKTARALLAKQDDFKSQKTWLAEVIESKGHACEFLPKFSPELNPIERVWACAKRYTREHCGKSIKSLIENVHKVFNDKNLISIEWIRRFYRMAWRYMDAYREKEGIKLTSVEVMRACKKYKSHRRIPEDFFKEIKEKRINQLKNGEQANEIEIDKKEDWNVEGEIEDLVI